MSFTTINFRFIYLICHLAAMTFILMKKKAFFTIIKRKITLEGLVQGQQYAIQVAGVGSNPKRVWSFEISSFVM